MNKNIKTSLILLLALLIVVSAVALVACKDPTSVTLTVNYGLPGVSNDTMTVDVGAPFIDKLTPTPSEYSFAGWYMSDGSQVTSTTVAPAKDFTVTAKWYATYRVEYWLEQADGTYAVSNDWSNSNYDYLGSTISAEVITISGFNYDASNVNNVASVTLDANDKLLKLYYKRNVLTVTFDKLISSATGTMQPISEQYGTTITLPQCGYQAGYTFVGWNTAADGTGAHYDDRDSFTVLSNVTLYAQWQTTYTVAVYQEQFKDNSNETQYVLLNSVETKDGIIGHSASVAVDNVDEARYFLDNGRSTPSGVVSEQGLALEVYFSLHVFEIRYTDDDTVVEVKYGASYTVRIPANDDPNAHVSCYSTETDGTGVDYQFGAEISNITANVTLHPVILDVYTDDADSGDTLTVRRNMTGLGSAVLNKDGTNHSGNVTTTGSYATFEIEIDDDVIYGRYYVEEDANLFHYRGEELGMYVNYNYLIGGFTGVVLVMDGYGGGDLQIWDEEREGWYIYVLEYAFDDEFGEYYLQAYSRGNLDEVYYADYFQYIQEAPEDFENFDGYFVFWNVDNEYNDYAWWDNQQPWSVIMWLDGFGNAIVTSYDENGEVTETVMGIYYASADYIENFDNELFLPEYVFESTNEEAFPSCTFKITYKLYVGEFLPVFLIQGIESGFYYASEDADYPAVYLDGFGNAIYVTSAADENPLLHEYTIDKLDGNTYRVVISFMDPKGGEMTIDIVVDPDDDNNHKTYTLVSSDR